MRSPGFSKQKGSCKSLFGFGLGCLEFLSHPLDPGFAAFCPDLNLESFCGFFVDWGFFLLFHLAFLLLHTRHSMLSGKISLLIILSLASGNDNSLSKDP